MRTWQRGRMTNLQQSIEQQVGVLVRNVSDLIRQEAIEALRRAVVVPGVSGTSAKPSGRPRPRSSGPSNRGSAAPRDPAELSALTKRLYAQVSSQPGEAMAKLALAMGCRSSELRVPMGHLVSKGRVRKAGLGKSICYFPMDPD